MYAFVQLAFYFILIIISKLSLKCFLKQWLNWQFTVPFEDKRTTQRVPHAEPTRWRFELNAFVFACPRKRKRV